MENFSKTSLMREAVAQRCSVKKVFLEISQTSQENTCVRVSFLIKSFFIKKDTLVQVFSCKFCEIFKNTFSYVWWLLLSCDIYHSDKSVKNKRKYLRHFKFRLRSEVAAVQGCS